MRLRTLTTLCLFALLVICSSAAAQEIKILDSFGVARAIKRGVQSVSVSVDFAQSIQSAVLVRDDGRSIAGQANGTHASFDGVSSGNWQVVSTPQKVAIKTVQIGH